MSVDLSRDQIVAIETISGLEGDDQILANRIVSRGADPFALELVVKGEVSDPIRSAHFQGPGHLKGEEKTYWLFLAYHSLDESKKSTLQNRIRHFERSAGEVRRILADVSEGRRVEYEDQAHRTLTQILSLLFKIETLQSPTHARILNLPVYTDDLGFASAYWSGFEFAGVLAEDGKLFIGSQDRPLAEIGFKVDVSISPQFGFIQPVGV